MLTTARPIDAPDIPRRATQRAGAALVVGWSLTIFVPLIVLGGAIDWPGSLDDPAEIALPRLADNSTAVRVGYLAYLVYSLAFLPVAVLVHRWIGRSDVTRPTIALQVATGLAAASMLARSIGIVRWLSTMLPMADRWDTATGDERVALAIQFDAINDYGGTIGEILGVSVLAAGWLAVASTSASVATPRWARISGPVVAALLFLPVIELAGFDAGPLITVSSTAINLWMLAIGIAMFRDAGTRPAPVDALETS